MITGLDWACLAQTKSLVSPNISGVSSAWVSLGRATLLPRCCLAQTKLAHELNATSTFGCSSCTSTPCQRMILEVSNSSCSLPDSFAKQCLPGLGTRSELLDCKSACPGVPLRSPDSAQDSCLHSSVQPGKAAGQHTWPRKTSEVSLLWSNSATSTLLPSAASGKLQRSFQWGCMLLRSTLVWQLLRPPSPLQVTTAYASIV